MTQPEEPSTRLTITPPLDEGEVSFLAGFCRESVPSHGSPGPRPGPDQGGGGRRQVADRPARLWPGQPAVPAPWVPCSEGCCLVLASPSPEIAVAGQWLRFLLAEFLTGQDRVSGWVHVPGLPGRRPALLMVEQGEVFEGQLADASGWSG